MDVRLEKGKGRKLRCRWTRLTAIFLDEVGEESGLEVLNGDEGAHERKGGGPPWAGKLGKRVKELAVDDADEEGGENSPHDGEPDGGGRNIHR